MIVINGHLRGAALVIFLLLRFAPLCSATSTLTTSPTNPRQLSNSALQFTALHNGKIVHGPVSWTSSNPAVATITGTSGTATANLLSMGTTTITATHGGQRGSTSLTVTVAVSPVFTAQPTNTNVSAVINPSGGVKVRLLDNLGDPLPSQRVTLSIGVNPLGTGTLRGTLTHVTDSTGTATFPDLKIDWLGNGYTLLANSNPSSGPVSGTSAEFDELRVGDACLAPDMPACSSGCADTDLDGLNDAWEVAGGVDLNGDGVITDSYHDVLLPGANPNAPDIYLKYDYMATSTHSHRPPENAWDQMKAMFAAHGIALHVLAPSGPIPEHQVTTLDPNAQPACAGNDFITSTQLRSQYFGNLQPAYHYMVFAHDSTTPNDGSLAMSCPADALCLSKPRAGATGIADVFGDDSIVSFGYLIDKNQPVSIELQSSAMMHELGHNFGLGHGSLADPGNIFQDYCSNYKPNYISVMNYDYELNTLVPATAAGGTTPISCTIDADCGPPNVSSGRCAIANSCFCTDDLGEGNNVCYRPDYAEDQLLNLNETMLDESVGVGGPSTLEDIVWYYVGSGGPTCPEAGTCAGPSNGSPIDWNNDGMITNLSGCIGLECPNINNSYGHTNDQMDTTADWTQVNGQFIHFNFQFQCTPGYQNDLSPSKGAQPHGRQVIKVPAGWPTQLVIQQ